MLVQPEANRVFRLKLTHHALHDLAIRHAVLKAPTVISAPLVQRTDRPSMSLAPLLAIEVEGLARDPARFGRHPRAYPAILVEQRERQPGDEPAPAQRVGSRVRGDPIEPGRERARLNHRSPQQRLVGFDENILSQVIRLLAIADQMVDEIGNRPLKALEYRFKVCYIYPRLLLQSSDRLLRDYVGHAFSLVYWCLHTACLFVRQLLAVFCIQYRTQSAIRVVETDRGVHWLHQPCLFSR